MSKIEFRTSVLPQTPGVLVWVETPGYGSGYSVVSCVEEGGKFIASMWPDGTVPTCEGVRIHRSGFRRVVGTRDTPAAARVRAAKYTRNWGDRGFLATATGAEIVHAMHPTDEREIYARMVSLQSRRGE